MFEFISGGVVVEVDVTRLDDEVATDVRLLDRVGDDYGGEVCV